MYKEFHLGGPLQPFVECAWMLQSDADGPGGPSRILPDGCTDLVVTIGKSVDLFGPISSFRLVSSRENFAGFRLRLGAAQALTGVAPEEMVDRSASLETVWGHSARDLERHLLAAARPEAALAMLEKALARRAGTAPEPDHLVRAAVDRLRCSPNTRVHQLAAVLEVSERQLRRRFQRHVGLSVKQLGRIIRFQRVADELRAYRRRFPHTSPGWAGLAHDHGYADQAHLVRESRAMAGATPMRLLMDC
jgi:AraC-like DNA-binding protein